MSEVGFNGGSDEGKGMTTLLATGFDDRQHRFHETAARSVLRSEGQLPSDHRMPQRTFAGVGVWSTTTGGLTVRWGTGPRRSLPTAVLLLALRLRLRSSSSTAEPLKLYPLPNPYSHNPWYRKRGQAK